MTPAEVKEKWDKLSPRERNVWIAEKVTQWDRSHEVIECEDPWYTACVRCGARYRCGHGSLEYLDDNECEYVKNCTVPPYYSSDISAAWEVLNKIRQNSFLYGIFCNKIGDLVSLDLEICDGYDAVYEIFYCLSPEMICLAALMVVEGCP